MHERSINARALGDEPTKVPDMEIVGGALHAIAAQLGGVADALESKVARFLGEPQNAASADTRVLQAAEPAPGTLASLQAAQTRLRDQADRLSHLVDKVKGIL